MTFSKKDMIFVDKLVNMPKYKKALERGKGLKNKKEFVDTIISYAKTFKSPRTQLSKISQIKIFLKKKFDYPLLFNSIKANIELKDKVQKMNFEAMKTRKNIKINEKNFLNLMKTFKNSGDNMKIFYYLSFVTGRRPIEILSSKFALPKTKTLKKIKVTGLAKKRVKRARQYFINIIDIFESRDEIFDKIIKIQNNYKESSPIAVIKRLRYHFYRNFKMSNVDKIHLLRSLYGEWLYKYKNPEDIIKSSFIADVLNHDGMTSAAHYQEIKFI